MEYKKSRWEVEYDNYNANKDQLKSKMAAIRREQAALKEGAEYAAKKKELEELKKTQVKYDKIEQNKSKIENILNFKKDLVEKTSMLLATKSMVEENEKKISNFEKELKSLDEERDSILKSIQQIDYKLKNQNLKEEERSRLQAEKNEKVNSIKENNTKYSETAKKKDEIEKQLEVYSIDKDKLNEDLLKNEKLLGKCDLIGANLLKGKSMEEISAKLENFEFKPNKDFAKKIQDMRDTYNKDKAQDNKEQEEKQEDKNEEKETENKEIQENAEDKEVEEKGQEDEEKPVPVSEFDQKHPRLAKIKNFFKKAYSTVVNKVSNIINKDTGEKEDEKDNETIHDDNEKPVEKTHETEKEPEQEIIQKTYHDFNYAMKKLDGKDQDKVLKEIAEKGMSGFRESMKVDKKQILENMRRQSAKEYAEKYGGRYATQDGANLDNKEDEGR